ncbi:MAG: hypothetical protein H0U36_13085 [Nocardioidaceae bacterium]|nr:hypothetical protein [Nocardioidaceae bacterium]
MTVGQVVVAGCALAIVLLAVGVVGLARRLSLLSRQVEQLQRSPAATPMSVPAPTPDLVPTPSGLADVPGGLHPGEPADEDITVITHLDVDYGPAPTTAQVASVTLGDPLIKVASFAHGVRRALREEQRMRIAYVVRKELRQQRKTRRRRRAEQAPSQGWRP